MRRPARLSFLLGRAPTLRFRTVFVEQPPLPASERRRAAAEAPPAYETSDDEGGWEEDDGLWEDEQDLQQEPGQEDQEGEDGEQEPEDQQAAGAPEGDETVADPSAAVDDREDTEAGDAGAAEGKAACAANESDEAGAAYPAVLQPREAEDESSNTAAQAGADGEEAAEGAENVPPAAKELQARSAAVTHSMLKETVDCSQGSMADLRVEMEERFAAIEKSLFFIMYALGANVPPLTRRRLGFNRKAGRAANAVLTTATAAASTGGGRR